MAPEVVEGALGGVVDKVPGDWGPPTFNVKHVRLEEK